MRVRTEGGRAWQRSRRPPRVHPARRQGEGHRDRPVHGRPQLHRHGAREVPLRRPLPREDPEDRHRQGAGAARRRRGRDPGRPARRAVRRRSSRTATSSRRTSFASRARSSPASPPSPRRSPPRRPALIEIDYEPLPVVSDFVRGDGAPVRRSSTTGSPTTTRTRTSSPSGNTMAYHTIVKGDADAAMAGAEVVVKGRYVSDASQGVPIEPRAVVAQWQGDKVTIWSSTQVPYAARAGVAQTLRDARGRRADRRAAARRRVRREVRPALRGPGRRDRARGASARSSWSSRARRSSPRSRSAARASSMEFETGVTRDGHARRAEGEARARQGRVLRRGRVPRADGRDARVRPVRDRRDRGRVLSELHEQPAVGVGPGADGAAGLLGPRAAHGRGRRARSAWTRSSSAVAR